MTLPRKPTWQCHDSGMKPTAAPWLAMEIGVTRHKEETHRTPPLPPPPVSKPYMSAEGHGATGIHQ